MLLRIDINTREEEFSVSFMLNLTDYIILALFGLCSHIKITYRKIKLMESMAEHDSGAII